MNYLRKNRSLTVLTFILVLGCFTLGWAWGQATCPQCNGSGKITAQCGICKGEGHSWHIKCGGCGGTGAVSIVCPTCHGSGKVPKK